MFLKKVKKKTDHRKKRLAGEAEQVETFIAAGSKIKGTISGQNNMRFAGYLDGQIMSKKKIWIDKQGRVDGLIKARVVFIEGEVKGDIESVEKTELRSGGRVTGNISCAQIAVADDAFFEGEIRMLPKEDWPVTTEE
jgi:cytoskeletal protein CcmA (bactofilin family)